MDVLALHEIDQRPVTLSEARAGFVIQQSTLEVISMATQKDKLNLNEELTTAKPEDLLIEEFSIIELEDRLELQARCNNNCDCDAF